MRAKCSGEAGFRRMMADSVVDRAPPVACVECAPACVLDDKMPLLRAVCSLAETFSDLSIAESWFWSLLFAVVMCVCATPVV